MEGGLSGSPGEALLSGVMELEGEERKVTLFADRVVWSAGTVLPGKSWA